VTTSDERWEEWLEMSDAEQDAELNSAMREYEKMLDSMPLRERISHHVGMCLRTCANWRRLIRDHDFDFAKDHLKQCQLRLAKLRIWRQTGIYPGSA
jgi:hypothetical protein